MCRVMSMRLHYSEFRLLRKGYCILSTSDCTDSMIMPESAYDFFRLFFEIMDFMNSWYDEWESELDSLYKSKDGVGYYAGVPIIEDVGYAYLLDWDTVNGYMLVYIEAGHASVQDKGFILAVVTASRFRFVGSISSFFGGVSTPELSRLIVSTPEINWNI